MTDVERATAITAASTPSLDIDYSRQPIFCSVTTKEDLTIIGWAWVTDGGIAIQPSVKPEQAGMKMVIAADLISFMCPEPVPESVSLGGQSTSIHFDVNQKLVTTIRSEVDQALAEYFKRTGITE